MTELIFATHNENKVKELSSILSAGYLIKSLAQIGITQEIDEPFDTLEENARIKATTIHQLTSKNCFSEDTGLLVEALNGEPGVRSARYAGEAHNFEANIDKLLSRLGPIENRTARFVTVIWLITDGHEYSFTGECKGRITTERIGTKGFGYDSVFIPDGSEKTFAQMEMEEKNLFSHRRKAVEKLISFLNKPIG